MMSKLGVVLVIFLVLSSMEVLRLDADGLAGVATKQKLEKNAVAEKSLLALGLTRERSVDHCSTSRCASDGECDGPTICGPCSLCTNSGPKCLHCECGQTNPNCPHK
uniref:Conopeptide n=1 Tax=Conus lenavati TaxID=1519839 RepID=A0A0K8TTP3_CONLV